MVDRNRTQRRTFPIAFGLLLLASAVAGCSAGGLGAAETSGTGSSPRPAAGPGAIQGRILDSSELPIVGARIQVTLSGSNEAPWTATTTETGDFLVSGLEPSQYVLYAVREGFRGRSENVDVPAEGVARLTLILQEQAILRPMHTSQLWRLDYNYYACLLTPARDQCTISRSTANQTVSVTVDESSRGPLQTMIVEARWQSGASLCLGAMRLDAFSPQQLQVVVGGNPGEAEQRRADNPYHWENRPDTRSPSRIFIPRTGGDGTGMLSSERTALNGGTPIKTSGIWHLTHYPEPEGELGTPIDVACLYEALVELWATTFYIDPSPQDWSVFDGG